MIEKPKISLISDRKSLNADGKDLCYVSVKIDDECSNKGLVNAVVDLYLSGDAGIINIDDQDNFDRQPVKYRRITLIQNRATDLVIQAGYTPSIISLTAIGQSFTLSTIKIKLRRVRDEVS